jgi:alkanesulfonate monooxygenase SsuD/methylene tetrahydromethanopterin reductase-like flavin-dependent oxidoreductase (luciferase family)
LTRYQGDYFRLDHARLFDRPDQPVPIVVAAGGPEAARLAGRKGDGLIATEPLAELVEAYRSVGGTGPRYAEVALVLPIEKTRRGARRITIFAGRRSAQRWRNCLTPKRLPQRRAPCHPKR